MARLDRSVEIEPPRVLAGGARNRLTPVGDEGITLISDGLEGDSFSGLLAAYERDGYERGYRRAQADLLSSLVGVTRDLVREASGSSGEQSSAVPVNAAALLVQFERRLQRHIDELRPADAYVSGGLGI